MIALWILLGVLACVSLGVFGVQLRRTPRGQNRKIRIMSVHVCNLCLMLMLLQISAYMMLWASLQTLSDISSFQAEQTEKELGLAFQAADFSRKQATTVATELATADAFRQLDTTTANMVNRIQVFMQRFIVDHRSTMRYIATHHFNMSRLEDGVKLGKVVFNTIKEAEPATAGFQVLADPHYLTAFLTAPFLPPIALIAIGNNTFFPYPINENGDVQLKDRCHESINRLLFKCGEVLDGPLVGGAGFAATADHGVVGWADYLYPYLHYLAQDVAGTIKVPGMDYVAVIRTVILSSLVDELEVLVEGTSNIMYVVNQFWQLIAVSRGTMLSRGNPPSLSTGSTYRPIIATDSLADQIIRESAQYLLTQTTPEKNITDISLTPRGLVQVFNNTEYFLSSTPLDVEGGLRWAVVMLIPGESVLGNVRRENVRLKAGIAERRIEVDNLVEESKAKVVEKKSAGVSSQGVIVAVVAVCCMLLAFGVGESILRPLRFLQEAMAGVANLELEAVELTPSRLFEIAEMQRSFQKMVSNLKEYRAYMPASVVLAAQQESSDEMDVTSDSKGTTSRSPVSPASPGSPASAIDRRSSIASSRSHQSRISVGPRRGVDLNVNALFKRTITIMMIDANGFHDLQKSLDPGDLVHRHTTYLHALIQQLRETRGLVDRFLGDKMMVSWNAMAQQGSHRNFAAKAALRCHEELKKADIGLSIRIGISSGSVLCGNLGIENFRCFSLLGAPVTLASQLEDRCRTTRCSTLIDKTMNSTVKYSMVTRIADVLPNRDFAYALVESKPEQEADEWMYQVEEQEKQNTDGEYESAWNAYAQGNIERAGQFLADHLAKHERDPLAQVLQRRIDENRLQTAIESV